MLYFGLAQRLSTNSDPSAVGRFVQDRYYSNATYSDLSHLRGQALAPDDRLAPQRASWQLHDAQDVGPPEQPRGWRMVLSSGCPSKLGNYEWYCRGDQRMRCQTGYVYKQQGNGDTAKAGPNVC